MSELKIEKPFITFYHSDGVAGLAGIKSNSVKCVLTDPPYLYLKGQKLEREFDEWLYFSKVRRVLTDEGFIVLFGRGTSFYRWNTILEQLGFQFKEEFVWDKGYISSPLMAISRVHETISIFTKKNGVINKVKVPYIEMKQHDIESIVTDIKRLKTTFNNTNSLNAVLEYLENNRQVNTTERKHNHSTSVQPSDLKNEDRTAAVMRGIKEGMNEKTIIRTDKKPMLTAKGVSVRKGLVEGDRCVNVINSMTQGMNEKSIIEENRDHYETIHPTQKPVPLLKRLLALTTNKGDLVVDNFAGSCSTGIAASQMERNFIGWEIDKEYFDKAVERIKRNHVQLGLF